MSRHTKHIINMVLAALTYFTVGLTVLVTGGATGIACLLAAVLGFVSSEIVYHFLEHAI